MAQEVAYKKSVSYTFEVDDEQYAITDWDEDLTTLEIEETRKNGQEDCHMKATVVWQGGDIGDGRYAYESETISAYESAAHARDVLRYLNEHKFEPE
jgi:hypothetical protein